MQRRTTTNLIESGIIDDAYDDEWQVQLFWYE